MALRGVGVMGGGGVGNEEGNGQWGIVDVLLDIVAIISGWEMRQGWGGIVSRYDV